MFEILIAQIKKINLNKNLNNDDFKSNELNKDDDFKSNELNKDDKNDFKSLKLKKK